MAGDCVLTKNPESTTAMLFIEFPGGTRKFEVRRLTKIKLIQPPHLVPFVRPVRSEEQSNVLVYTATKENSSWGRRLQESRLRNGGSLWRVDCYSGTVKEGVQRCLSEGAEWENSAVNIYVVSENRNFLRLFAYEMTRRGETAGKAQIRYRWALVS